MIEILKWLKTTYNKNNVIVINLNNVHREEQQELKDYLESNYWDWKQGKNDRWKERNREYAIQGL